MRAQHLRTWCIGVTTGFSKTLEIVGTGYRAAMDGKKLVLQLGYSHPIHFDAAGRASRSRSRIRPA